MSQQDSGVSPAIGFILLVGLSLIVVSLVVVAGSSLIEQRQQAAQVGNVENSFEQLDALTSAVAYGGTQSARTIDLGVMDQNSEIRAKPGGKIKVVKKDISSGSKTTIISQKLGKVVYENNEVRIVYQNGGVWKHNKITGNSKLISPPEFDYRGQTLSIPLIVIENRKTATVDSTITIKSSDSKVVAVNSRLQGKRLIIKITSNQYKSWGHYFERRVTGNVKVEYNHTEETAIIKLGRSEQRRTIDSGIETQGKVIVASGGKVYGPVTAGGQVNTHGGGKITGEVTSMASINQNNLNTLIKSRIEYQESQGETINKSKDVYTEGTYFVDDTWNVSENKVFDVTGGNITIVADSDIYTQDSHLVVKTGNTNNHVEIYTDSDFQVGNSGKVKVKNGNAKGFRLYGTSESSILIQNGGDFEGVVYFPTSDSSDQIDSEESSSSNDEYNKGQSKYDNVDNCPDATLCTTSGADYNGAFIGRKVDMDSGGEFTYNEEIGGFTLHPVGSSTYRPLGYVHISVNKVKVK